MADIFNIEDATIMGGRFRNFSGRGDKFNPEGKRYFNLKLDDKTFKAMKKDGYNVKELDPREEGEEPLRFVKVNVNYGGFKPPKIYTVMNDVTTLLTEKTVEELDYADIEKVDVIIRPYEWSNAKGEKGVSAYIQTMYAILEEDPFAYKYSAKANAALDKEAHDAIEDDDDVPF